MIRETLLPSNWQSWIFVIKVGTSSIYDYYILMHIAKVHIRYNNILYLICLAIVTVSISQAVLREHKTHIVTKNVAVLMFVCLFTKGKK